MGVDGQQDVPSTQSLFNEAYGRRLTALELRSTSGQIGYASQTIYNVFEHNDNTDNNTVMPITQTVVVVGIYKLPLSQYTCIGLVVACSFQQKYDFFKVQFRPAGILPTPDH